MWKGKLMEKEFITYEQALVLKELGFEEPCFAYYSINDIENKLFYDIDPDDGELTALNQNQFYHNNLSEVGRISSPLKQQVFRFFRGKHNFDGWATPCYTSDGKFYSFIIENGKESEIDGSYDDFETYEEAELACIDKLIEIIKNK